MLPPPHASGCVAGSLRGRFYPGRILLSMTLTPTDVYPLGAAEAPFQVVDVRAPVEVERGALPGALALPLLMDEERHLVGVRYQEAGQRAAIDLGYELLEHTLPGRVEGWRRAVAAAPTPTAVACWRGGLRSQLVVEFVADERALRVEGGYKALRSHLSKALPLALASKRLVVLTGLTGAGKTRLLRGLETTKGSPLVVDLEGLARHRGSAFGHVAEPQPSQQTFENSLAAEFVLSPARRVVLEDESRFVGKRTIPDALYGAMTEAPLVVLEADLATRSQAIYAEYVDAPTAIKGRDVVAADLLASTKHLGRRLSMATREAISQRLAELVRSEEAWADGSAHEVWIGSLLSEHYDPLYRRALGKRSRPVVFAGDEKAVTEWLAAAW